MTKQKEKEMFANKLNALTVRVKELYNEHLKLDEIAKKLNQEGFKTRTGKDFKAVNVSYFLVYDLGIRHKKEFTRKDTKKRNFNKIGQINTVETKNTEFENIEIEDSKEEKSLIQIKPLEFETVYFNGAELLAIKGDDGKLYSPLKKFCEQLGIDYSSQLQRIKRKPVLLLGMVKITIPTKGGLQSTICLNVDFLPMWLSDIETEQCKEEVRPMLLEFQLYVKDVLAKAFIKKEPPKEEPKQEPVKEFTATDFLLMTAESIKEQKQKVESIENNLKAVNENLSNQIDEINKKLNEIPKNIPLFNTTSKGFVDVQMSKADLELRKLNQLKSMLKKHADKYAILDGSAWNELYKSYKLNFGIDLKNETKKFNENKTNKNQLSTIQFAFKNGHLDKLIDCMQGIIESVNTFEGVM